jgi:sterol desaturase/sphingolipid hydroxylase (fatty acid hydroxylase superfamily)
MTQATGNPTRRVGDYDVDVRGRGRQFKNDFLESLSHCHGLLPLFIYGPVVILCLVLLAVDTDVGFAKGAALVAAGVAFWTFFEYWMHREVFHWKKFPKAHYFLHGIHHIYPNDKGRMVMPPSASAFVAVPMWFLCLALFGYGPALAIFAGFVAGYVWYDETHYWTHVGKARTRWGKRLKKHHMMHHFQTPGQRFGVSTPLWDWVFGTLPKDDSRGAADAEG